MKTESKYERHVGERSATIWFDEAMLNRVDRLAAKGDISRSRLIRNLTEIGVGYLEASEKVGLFQTAVIMRDFAEWFKEKCESGVEGRPAKA